jgi:hypothetical protein
MEPGCSPINLITAIKNRTHLCLCGSVQQCSFNQVLHVILSITAILIKDSFFYAGNEIKTGVYSDGVEH